MGTFNTGGTYTIKGSPTGIKIDFAHNLKPRIPSLPVAELPSVADMILDGANPLGRVASAFVSKDFSGTGAFDKTVLDDFLIMYPNLPADQLLGAMTSYVEARYLHGSEHWAGISWGASVFGDQIWDANMHPIFHNKLQHFNTMNRNEDLVHSQSLENHTEISHNSDGSITATTTDENTASVSKTTYIQDGGGDYVPYTTVQNGLVYGADTVASGGSLAGQELNALDQLAEINSVKNQIATEDAQQQIQADRRAQILAQKEARMEAAAGGGTRDAGIGGGSGRDDDDRTTGAGGATINVAPVNGPVGPDPDDNTAPQPGTRWEDDDRVHVQDGPNTQGHGLQSLVRPGHRHHRRLENMVQRVSPFASGFSVVAVLLGSPAGADGTTFAENDLNAALTQMGYEEIQVNGCELRFGRRLEPTPENNGFFAYERVINIDDLVGIGSGEVTALPMGIGNGFQFELQFIAEYSERYRPVLLFRVQKARELGAETWPTHPSRQNSLTAYVEYEFRKSVPEYTDLNRTVTYSQFGPSTRPEKSFDLSYSDRSHLESFLRALSHFQEASDCGSTRGAEDE